MAINPVPAQVVLPAAPDRNTQQGNTFSNAARTWSFALPDWGDWLNSVGSNVYNNALEAEGFATTATAQAVAAANSATLSERWATDTGALVNGIDYSAKEYAIGTTAESAKRHASGTVATGSAKDWASSTTEVADGLKGARGYAQDASASEANAANSASFAQSVIDGKAGVFNTVGNMIAASFLVVGDRVRTLGYNTIGDGGGNDYEVVAAGTGLDDGGSFIDLTASGHQAKGLFVDGRVTVEQFGAKPNDNTHDSSQNINNALALGGRIHFGADDYFVQNTMSIGSNTTLVCSGSGTGTAPGLTGGTTFIPLAGFSGSEVMLVDDESTYLSSCELSNFKILLSGFDIDGIVIKRPYDSVKMTSINIINIGDNTSGLKVLPSGSGGVGQSFYAENIVAIHQNSTAIAPTIYLEKLQEFTLVNLKCFSSYQSGVASAIPLHMVDCRGGTLVTPSFAHGSAEGCLVEAVSRNSIGITIINPTVENITTGLKAAGSGGFTVQRLNWIHPRFESPVTNSFDVDDVTNCEFHSDTLLGLLGSNTTQCLVHAQRQNSINNLGTRNSIYSIQNAIDDFIGVSSSIKLSTTSSPKVIFDAGRAGTYNVFWSASASADFGMVWNNQGTTHMTLTQSGDLQMALAQKGLIVKTPDGLNNYRIRVDNSGNLVTDLL